MSLPGRPNANANIIVPSNRAVVVFEILPARPDISITTLVAIHSGDIVFAPLPLNGQTDQKLRCRRANHLHWLTTTVVAEKSGREFYSDHHGSLARNSNFSIIMRHLC